MEAFLTNLRIPIPSNNGLTIELANEKGFKNYYCWPDKYSPLVHRKTGGVSDDDEATMEDEAVDEDETTNYEQDLDGTSDDENGSLIWSVIILTLNVVLIDFYQLFAIIVVYLWYNVVETCYLTKSI